MRYVDHEPGAWFLLEDEGVLYLDARYSHSAVIDDSALIRLDESELRGVPRLDWTHNNEFTLSQASRDLLKGMSDPVTVTAYFTRDLYRSAAERELRDAVGAAIVDHTWTRAPSGSEPPRRDSR